MKRRRKKLRLKIVNRSKWPDGFLRVVCRWIGERAGVPPGYCFEFPSFADWHSYGGRGGDYGQRTRMNRRFMSSRKVGGKSPWPYRFREDRFAWSAKDHLMANRIEAFVYLVAHEAYHSTGGHPKNFRVRPGRCDNASMEFRCNKFAWETVLAFRDAWPKLKTKVRAAMRADADAVRRVKDRKATARSPDGKLVRVLANLSNWERKLKFAQNKVAGYKRKARYYQGRVAAKTKGDSDGSRTD